MKRQSNGLLDEFNYQYDEFGFIDWASIVPSKYKYPNKDWFYRHGKDIPESAEGLSEDQTIISLAGLKWVAKIRGYLKVSNKILHCSKDKVVARCKISWIGDHTNVSEFACNDVVEYSDCASATVDNTQEGFGKLYLEAIAVNRAFARCVRNFLGINSVSDVEMEGAPSVEGGEPEQEKPTVVKAQGALEILAKEKGFNSFDEFRSSFKALEFFHKQMEDWVDYKNIPAKDSRTLMAKLKKLK